jgi:hypothetical protein
LLCVVFGIKGGKLRKLFYLLFIILILTSCFKSKNNVVGHWKIITWEIDEKNHLSDSSKQGQLIFEADGYFYINDGVYMNRGKWIIDHKNSTISFNFIDGEIFFGDEGIVNADFKFENGYLIIKGQMKRRFKSLNGKFVFLKLQQ